MNSNPDAEERCTADRFRAFLSHSPNGISEPMTVIRGVGGALGLWILEATSREISYGVIDVDIDGPTAAAARIERTLRLFETRPGEKTSQTYARALRWMSEQAVAELRAEER